MKKALIIIGIIVVIVVAAVFITFKVLDKEKEMITADEFNTTMKEKGYQTGETTYLFAQYPDYMKKSFAAKKDECQVEFYELTTVEHAISMYNTNKEKFESEKSGASTSKHAEVNNYATFALTTNGKYKFLSRVENTLIYVDVDEKYKDTIEDLIKDLGY